MYLCYISIILPKNLMQELRNLKKHITKEETETGGVKGFLSKTIRG